MFRYVVVCALVAACGSKQPAMFDAPHGGDDDGGNPGDDGNTDGNHVPMDGAVVVDGITHALRFYKLFDNNTTSITTLPVTTPASGTTMLVSVGRGDITAFQLPTDNKGNAPYLQRDITHAYTHYTTSGTALYTFTSAAGGAGFTVSTPTKPSDEITLATVGVGGTQVHDFHWNEVVQPAQPIPVTSGNVTTTGPATLVAFWWGDADGTMPDTIAANNGFVILDSVVAAGNLVQCAVAVKKVTAAGTYNVTWTATPIQGAQLWIVAVQ